MNRPSLVLAACRIDLDRGEVRRDGEVVPLSTREAALLAYFVENAARLITRDELLREVWNYDPQVVTTTVRTTVSRLRKKIERDPADPDHLLTEYGSGYRFRLPERVQSPVARATTPTNLGAETTSFVGRESELATLEEMGRAERRLISLVGTAGVGKTRLARRHGLNQLDLPGGVWFCDLSNAVGTEDVVRRVAGVLGVRLSTGDPAERVGRVLAARGPLLLVLDNFEQVLVARGVVARWLEDAPEARMVVTSREPLQLGAETVLPVAPLSADHASTLFVDRARSRRWDLHLDPHDPQVRDIVNTLDGLPLAVELAAAWVDALALDHLARDLSTALRASRLADLQDHHLTIDVAIARSWALLSDDERATLATCAVFRGGFDAAAVAAVATVPTGKTLSSLLMRSLLREAGSDRLDLYETVRVFLAERVPGGARDRHLAHYLERAHTLGGQIADRATRGPALDALARDLDNFVAAQQTALTTHPPAAIALVQALEPLFKSRGPSSVHLAMAEAALQDGLAPEDEARARLAWGFALDLHGEPLRAVSVLAPADALSTDAVTRARIAVIRARALVFQADPRAEAVITEALDRAERSGDDAVRGAALQLLGGHRWRSADRTGAEGALKQALPLLQGDGWLRPLVLGDLAEIVSERGRPEEAAELVAQALAELDDDREQACKVHLRAGGSLDQFHEVEQSLAHYDQAVALIAPLGNDPLESRALWRQGSSLLQLGRHDAAEAALSRALQLCRRVGDPRLEAAQLDMLGFLQLDRGDFDQARRLHRQALDLHRAVGETIYLAVGLVFSAEAALVCGAPDVTVTLVDELLALTSDGYRSLESGARVLRAVAWALRDGTTDAARDELAAALALGDGNTAIDAQWANEVYAGVLAARADPPRTNDARRCLQQARGRRADVSLGVRLAMRVLSEALGS